MTDLINIPVRNINELSVIPFIPLDVEILDDTKIPVGNLPSSLTGEAITVAQLKTMIAEGLPGWTPEILEELVVTWNLKADDVIAKGFYTGYATEAALLASKPDALELRARADNTRKIWRWNRTSAEGVTPITGTWTDTGLSDKDIAAADATVKADAAETRAKMYADNQVNPIRLGLTELKKANDPTIIPMLSDKNNVALVYYDKVLEKFVGAGLIEEIFSKFETLKKANDPRYLAWHTDKNGKILLGYDKLNDEIVGVFGEANPVASNNEYVQFKYDETFPVYDANHSIGYGQSLGTGATATFILSNSQPYGNTTFGFTAEGITYSSPRMDVTPTSIQPLKELFKSPASDGGTNRGETFCSGSANYSTLYAMQKYGVSENSQPIFASTAAHGGYRINQLNKGTPWYDFFISHITNAKTLHATIGKSYGVLDADWIQGENDAVTGTQTPYSVYKPALAQLAIDANTDIKAITGQTHDIRFITYQMSYAARTWPDMAKAQLDLVRENDMFMLSTPMYHFPYSDSIHLTNVGYKWFGAYIGRARAQYLNEHRKSDYINPLRAIAKDKTIEVFFNVPTLPLKIDSETLAATKNHGFKIMNDVTENQIISITASVNKVIITCANNVTEGSQVRYALDYLGSGLSITGGASGNLRDSTTDTVEISGQIKPLYHVCPHFNLNVMINKGI